MVARTFLFLTGDDEGEDILLKIRAPHITVLGRGDCEEGALTGTQCQLLFGEKPALQGPRLFPPLHIMAQGMGPGFAHKLWNQLPSRCSFPARLSPVVPVA